MNAVCKQHSLKLFNLHLMKGKINLIIVSSIQVVMVKTSVFIEDILYKYQVVEFTPTPPDLKWRLFGSVR